MSKYTIELPIRIDCDDYHEFSYLETFFKKLVEDIKIEEVGFDGSANKYIGIVYVGSISKNEYDELMENTKAKGWLFSDEERFDGKP